MRKKFTIFLLTAAMSISACGCCGVHSGSNPSSAVIEIEAGHEDAAYVVLSVAPTDAFEAAVQKRDSQSKEWEEDYMALMKESCLNGDIEAGRRAEASRNAKIEALGLDTPEISFDELYELSKIITSEAGSSWIPMDWKMMVGEVVLNRVSSVEFPNTVMEVIYQKEPCIQYAGTNSRSFKTLIPYADCVEAASRLLSGERVINDKSVVFQSSSRRGGGVYQELYDRRLGYTYLCYSNYPELYVKNGGVE